MANDIVKSFITVLGVPKDCLGWSFAIRCANPGSGQHPALLELFTLVNYNDSVNLAELLKC